MCKSIYDIDSCRDCIASSEPYLKRYIVRAFRYIEHPVWGRFAAPYQSQGYSVVATSEQQAIELVEKDLPADGAGRWVVRVIDHRKL